MMIIIGILIGLTLGFSIGLVVAGLLLVRADKSAVQVINEVRTAATGRIDNLLGRKQIKVFKKKESQPFEKDVLDKLDAEIKT